MKIELKGHSFEDAVRQILQLFFDINSEFDVITELDIEENIYRAKAKITLGERQAEGEIEMQLFCLLVSFLPFVNKIYPF